MKVIAITNVFNEKEYIRKSIENSLSEGLYPIVIDNGCIDGTIEIAQSMHITVLRHHTKFYDFSELIAFGVNAAKSLGCDWYILKDVDEIFTTYNNKSLIELIKHQDKLGYNCINCDSYSFWATVDDNLTIEDFEKRMEYYTFFDIPHMRIVKNCNEVKLVHPHLVAGNAKPSQDNAIIKHYKFVNAEQGKRKVKSRRERYLVANKAIGSHTHYNNFTYDDSYYVLTKDIYSKLNKFDGTWIRKQVWNEWR